MKKSLVRYISLLLILVMSAMFLASCTGFDMILGYEATTTTTSATIPSTGDNITNNIIIQGDGADLTSASNQGLRSSVSIRCIFGSGVLGGGNVSAGSGIIYKVNEDGDAFIITNYHVVYDENATTNKISNNISIYIYGMEYAEYAIPATYVGGSINYDIAVLRVENNDILKTAYTNGAVAPVEIADSDKVAPGQTAIAIGNPEAEGISVTTGVISVDSENIELSLSGATATTMRVMRTDTPVNSGNSGGGLFDGTGKLIGIVNAKILSAEVENIGYAIPSNVARALADNIIDYCFGKDCKTVMRGMLGIGIIPVSLYTLYDEETGILERIEIIRVEEVTSGGLGEAILKKNDIIKSIKIGERTVTVTRQHHIIDAMLDVRVGDTVSMTIERNGEEMTVSTVITQGCLTAY